jgi:uncharacterized protein YbjT (DUF2867 family)
MPDMILVTGSTGYIGRHLVPRLVDAGWPVRIMVMGQRGSTIRLPWPDLNVDIVEGSIYEPFDLLRAMEGVHTVYHLASAQWWGRARDLDRVDVIGTENIVSTAQRARIGRVIVMSHLGAAPASAYALYRAKGRAETLVRESGLPYTIVRSGIAFGEDDRFVNGIAMMLQTNPLVFLQPGQGENLLHPLYIHDLTRGLVRCMDNLETVDRTLEVGGPEYLTFNEMVRTVMRVTNSPRSIVVLPPYLVRFLTGLMGRVFLRWPTTPQWFDMISSHRTASLNSMSETFGIKPARFEDTLLTYMPEQHYTQQLLRFLFRRRRPRGN